MYLREGVMSITNQRRLESRGYLKDGVASEFEHISYEEKLRLLESKVAIERTLGARLLAHHKSEKTVDNLIDALVQEKKLYPKIEISKTLSGLQELALYPLIQCLGKIGNNQHKIVPEKSFSKDSYPLPRDIASRALVKMGEMAIPALLIRLETVDIQALSELIDTIGHINFYNEADYVYEPLKSCYQENESNDLIKWKLIRAFSGVYESEEFLKKQYHKVKNQRLQLEISRSLRLLKKINH